MLLSLSNLNDFFLRANRENFKYVGVRIAIGLNKEETIINPQENFEQKRAYYNHAYDEFLRHKFAGNEDIRITGFAMGDSYADIEEGLTMYDVTGNTALN